ncbi:MAG: hypothetical protein ACFCUU_14515, partial [Cyclobacteriaceae bacterium]
MLLSSRLFAQTTPIPFSITTAVLPPYSTSLESYAEKTRVTLINDGEGVQLLLSIKGPGGIELNTLPQSNIPIITTPSQQPYTLSSFELEPFFNLGNLAVAGIDPAIIRTRGLPPGLYQFCFTGIDIRSGQVLNQPPVGCSAFLDIRELQPPFIVSPRCGQVIKHSNPQNVVFAWTPSPGAPPNTPYTLRIVEVWDPSIPAGDALLSATSPPFFERTFYGSTSFLYGPAEPLFDADKKYAFEVVAGTLEPTRDMRADTRFANNGRSEPCYFTFGEPTEEPLRPRPQRTAKGTSIGSPMVIANFPISVIRGKLEFRFLKSEGENNQSFTDMILLAETVNIPQNKVEGFVLADAAVKKSLMENEFVNVKLPGNKEVTMKGSKINQNLPSQNKILSSAPSTQSQIPIQSIATKVILDPHLSHGGGKVYPAGNLKVFAYADLSKLQEIPEGVKQSFVMGGSSTMQGFNKPAGPNVKIKVGESITNAEGEFSILMFSPNVSGWPVVTHQGKKYRLDKIEIKTFSSHIDFPVKTIPLLENEEAGYDLGVINGLARTYRLQVEAVDEDFPNIILENAQVAIYRRSNFYKLRPFLRSEHDRTKDSIIGGSQPPTGGMAYSGSMMAGSRTLVATG